MFYAPSFKSSRFIVSIAYFFRVMTLLFIFLLSLAINPAYATSLGDLFGNDAASSNGQKEFLDVDEAFSVVPMLNGDKLTVLIEVTPEHYVYKDKIKLNLPEGVSAAPFTFNQTASFVDDPLFGKVAVFEQSQITAKTTLSHLQAAQSDKTATLIWQGCAKAGLCYPPQREKLDLSSLTRPAPASGTQAQATSSPATGLSNLVSPKPTPVSPKAATPRVAEASEVTKSEVTKSEVTKKSLK